MQGVSKLAVRFAAVSILVSALLVQPVMAASNSVDGSSWRTYLKRLVTRILDTTDISFPPG